MVRRVAWFVFATSVALAAAGGYLSVRNGEPLLGNSFPIAAAISFPLVGALVVARQPQNTLGWLFLTAGLSEPLAMASSQYATYGLVTAPGSLPGSAGMAWLSEWAWIPGFAIITTLAPLLFPDGRPPSTRWRVVAWMVAVALTVILVAQTLTWPQRGSRLLRGVAVEPALVSAIGGGAFALLMASIPPALVSMLFRFRRSSGDERQQLKWFAYGASVTVALVLVAQAVDFEGVLHLIAIPLIPAATAIAIVRYRLYEIDLVINRSVVYGVLTAVVFGAYVGGVTLFDRFARRNGLAASLLTAVVVAILFQPLRDRIQRTVNRLMFGLRDDPYAALALLGRRLEASEAANVLPEVAEAVAQALRLPYAGIELSLNGTPQLVAAAGAPAGEPQKISLVYQGETVGALLVSPRAHGDELSPADRRVLADLAPQVGVAAHAVRLTRDLQRSRERLVEAMEEERRRLRRDLHDGLGPALAGIALKIEAARNVLGKDLTAADDALAGLGEKIQGVLGDIRRLVYGLRPPALDELGLVAAIREQATRLTGASVTIDAPGEPAALPAAVEVAAYRIVTEALTNAARHADASSCTVRLSLLDGFLEIDVSDDGRGIPEGIQPGVGMSSMRERAEELGGTLIVRRLSGGGSQVLARLPLVRP
jgi:signal transduction histidine kinase